MVKFVRGFIAWIGRKLTPRPKSLPLIVEIEKGVLVHGGDEAAIASLKTHPGYVALINKFRVQRAYLLAQLEKNRHSDIRDVDFIQSALYWTRYIESSVRTAVEGQEERNRPVREVTDTELEVFNQIRASIESVRDNA